MHKHTIDWLRQVNITADTALAEKRWACAEKIAKKLTRARIIELLRLFLFPELQEEFTKQFTDELLKLDGEFPVTGNIQDLRMLAGLVIVSLFEEPSHEADAFALGIRCANFPPGRTRPVQPAMVTEAELYLQNEAGRLRPDQFISDGAQLTKRLVARSKEVTEAIAAGDAAKQNSTLEAFRNAVVDSISDSHAKLAARTEQLAEEIALLWWVFNEYSDTLSAPTRELTHEAYALAAAAEAAARTHITPPPPSIGPLLGQALRNCKPGKEKPTLLDYLNAASPSWRGKFTKTISVADCRDLVPISAGLEKTEEFGDSASAVKAMPKLCPGVPVDVAILPEVVAKQLYAEIVFLRALGQNPVE